MKRMKRLLVILCCAVLLFCAFPFTAFAKEYLTSWPQELPEIPKVYGYEWASLGAAKSARVVGRYFVIETTATLSSGEQYDEAVYLSFPEEGGFRLQSKHEYQQEVEASHAGLFEPKGLCNDFKRTDTDGTVLLHGNDGTNVRYTATADGFRLQVCSATDNSIVSITNKQISYAYKDDEVVRVMVEMPITADGNEVIYGGGERFYDVNQIGRIHSLTNTGAANWGSFTYINVPLWHSNRGYSIWFNMVYPGEADMGKSNTKKYSITFDGDKLDFFLWAGMPEENLKKYTALTGTSGVHEDWVYSFWEGACDTYWELGNASENLETLLEGYYKNYGFYPRSVGGEYSVGVNAATMAYQNSRGIRPLGWFMPSSELISKHKDNDLNGMEAAPVFDADGNLVTYGYPYPYVESLFKKGIYKILDTRWYDGSNPAFEQVIKNRWNNFWDWGSRGAMLDYGEKYSFYGTSWNGLSGIEMHNLNAYYIAKSHYNAWTERLGNDFVLYERAGTAGSQYYVGNFLGDQYGTREHFMTMVYAMINLGASGFNNYGGDMFSNGGIKYAELNQDLRNRYVSLGTFSPYMRKHGTHLIMPWEEGEVLAQNFGTYFYFRENLVPSIMSAAIDAEQNATPMVKGMMLAYPYQLTLSTVENQYLFCNDYLVCVVEDDNAHSLQVSLPDGESWYSLYTYKKYTGGQTIDVEAPTAFMPVFVRAGSVKAIDLPESQVLGDEMHPTEQINNPAISNDYLEQEAPHDSLLITPPDKERKTTIYVKEGESTDFHTYEYHTENYVSAPIDNATFTVTNTEGSSRQTVLALGVAASAVSYDGQKLERLEHIPDYFNEEYGYYVERSGLTTIYLPQGWKSLEIVKGNAGYDAYTLVGDTFDIKSMVDDSVKTAGEIKGKNPIYFTMDGEDAQTIGRIVVKWGAGYLSDYDIEYSDDGDEWTLLVAEDTAEAVDRGEHWWSMETATAGRESTVEGGAGGFDVINFDPVDAYYLRLTPKKTGDTTTVAPVSIASLEVYPPDDFEIIPADEEELPDYDDFDEDEDWSDWEDTVDEDDGDGEKEEKPTSEKKKKKVRKLIISGVPLWVWIVCIGGGVLVVTAAVIFFLLYRKKRAARAAALVADDGDEDGTSDA